MVTVTNSYSSQSKLLTTVEAAKVLRIHENTLRRWCNAGLVKCYRIGSRGDRRLHEEDVKAVLRSQMLQK